MSSVIKVENLSKQYRLGVVDSVTFKEDAQRWWAKLRGKRDPFLDFGVENDRTIKDNSKFVWSLRDISFDVEPGDVLGVIGRNGAGKSTLLKILSKVTAPTLGSVKIRGRIASLLEVGTGFHPELTGRENIYLNGAILGMRKQEISRKLDEIIAFAGVEKYVDTPVKRYSSGMYVRLAFAVAAHLDSEILIIDEVLAVGDAEFQKKCLGKMGEISHGQGRTVLFVSHNIASIKQLCNKGLLLLNGQTSSYGNIDDVCDNYLNNNREIINLNLQDRQDRIGNQDFIFKEIFFHDKDGKFRDNFFSDEEIFIELHYIIPRHNSRNKVDIGIAFNNMHSLQLFNVTTEDKLQTFYNLPSEGKITCKIDKILLTSGIYNLNLFSKLNDEISDWIINTKNLIIEHTDFYNTGKNTDSEQSLFLVNYNFF